MLSLYLVHNIWYQINTVVISQTKEIEETPRKEINPTISYHALDRINTPQTLKIEGYIKKKKVTMLQKIGSMDYKLELLASSWVHPIFHVSFLNKVIGDEILIQIVFLELDKEGKVILEPEKNL